MEEAGRRDRLEFNEAKDSDNIKNNKLRSKVESNGDNNSLN